MIYRPRFTYVKATHEQEERETASPNPPTREQELKSTIFGPERGPLDLLQLKPKLPITPLPQIAYPWHEPNQPAFTLRDLQQLLSHLSKTPLPRLPTPEGEPREAPFPKPPTREQEPEPIASIPVPIWKILSLVHIYPAPNPHPTNRPIGITVIQPTHQIPLMSPPTREPEHELTVIVPRDLQQLLNQLPIQLRDILQNAKFITTLPITNPPREPIVNPPIPITPIPIIRPSEGGSEREQITSLPIELPEPTPPIIFTPRDLLQPLTYFLAQEQELRPPTFTPQELLQAHLTY